MGTFLLTAVSGLAYAGFCATVCRFAPKSPFSARGGVPPGDARPEGAAALAGIASFLLIPPGSLPAFCGGDYGLAAWLVLFLCAGAALRPSGLAGALRDAAPLVAGFALLALYARQNGVPGELLAPGTYTATPWWAVRGIAGKAGIFFLLLALLPSFIPPAEREEPYPLRVRRLSLAAVLVCLFLPWNPSGIFAPGAFPAFILDFFFFWGKLILCAALFPPLALRLRAPRIRTFLFIPAALLMNAQTLAGA